MRIGILTFHRAYNCGAMLQAWALQTVLERMGHQVAFPACNRVGYLTRKYRVLEIPPDRKGLRWLRSFLWRLGCDIWHYRDFPRHFRLYDRFRRRHLHEVQASPADLPRLFDLVVVGSDQVWNDLLSEDDAPVFFGENVDGRLPYIAYAASCGDLPLTGERRSRVLSALGRFAAVSVREQLVKDLIQEFCARPVPVVLDPSLLLTAGDYQAIAHRGPQGRYLYCYATVANRFVVDTVRALANRLGLKPIITALYGRPTGCLTAGDVEDEAVEYEISPERMIGYIRDSECVVADSFHGTAIALLFGKPLVSLREQVDTSESRAMSLLRQVGEAKRLVNPATPIEEMRRLLTVRPAEAAQRHLKELRDQSLAWLGEALGDQMTESHLHPL